MDLITLLVNNINNLSSGKESFFIAIDGNGGAGKSTLSKYLKNENKY